MHLRKNDTIANLLRISLKYTQLQLGLETHFLSLDYDDYSYLLLENTWLTHLWQYVSSRGLQVHLTDHITIQKKSPSDKFIMEVLHEGNMTTEEKIIANKVRIALQILHVSEIVDGRGRRLLPDVRNGALYRKTKLQWPKQVLIRKWIPIWHKACGILQRYVSKHKIDLPKFSTTQELEWMMDSTHTYITNGNCSYKRKKIKERYLYRKIQETIPSAVRCDTRVDLTFIKNNPKIIYIYDDNSTSRTESDYDKENEGSPGHDWKHIFGTWDSDETVETNIAGRIKSGKILTGLDGSVTNGMGAYSFGIFTEDATPIYEHHGPVHGEADQQNSTRSEMHGILGLILYLTYIMEKYQIGRNCPRLKVLGDNMESLRVAREGVSLSLKNVFSSDMDVAIELSHQVKHHELKFTFEHVKSQRLV